MHLTLFRLLEGDKVVAMALASPESISSLQNAVSVLQKNGTNQLQNFVTKLGPYSLELGSSPFRSVDDTRLPSGQAEPSTRIRVDAPESMDDGHDTVEEVGMTAARDGGRK